MRTEWKYATSTESAIRAALLRLLAEKRLADITVSELAREAHVSRSTFYEHFGNPADVYDGIVGEFSTGLSSMMDQLACASEIKPAAKPFCARLREGGPFGPAVSEERFLTSFLERPDLLEKHDLHAILANAGYTPSQARALCAFQLSGCFTAARMSGDDGEWQDAKALIDRFIIGGVAACLAAKQPAARQDG